jgi:hypothetical protein
MRGNIIKINVDETTIDNYEAELGKNAGMAPTLKKTRSGIVYIYRSV